MPVWFDGKNEKDLPFHNNVSLIMALSLVNLGNFILIVFVLFFILSKSLKTKGLRNLQFTMEIVETVAHRYGYIHTQRASEHLL